MEKVTPAVQATVFILTSAVIAGGVMVAYWFNNVNRYPGLEERINQYYELERQNKWSKAYAYFAPGFKKKISQQFFISKKQKSTSDWKLTSFEIHHAAKKDGKLKVKMELTGSLYVSGKNKKTTVSNKKTKRIVWSIWENVNGDWYAWQTRSRDIKSFNYDVSLN